MLPLGVGAHKKALIFGQGLMLMAQNVNRRTDL